MFKIVVSIITHDFYKEEKYILSSREDSIVLPSWDIEEYSHMEKRVKGYLIDNIFVHNEMSVGYLNPKFISINDDNISNLFPDSLENLYFLYGCLSPKLTLKPDFYWKTFDLFDTNIITELGVINEVISKTI
jgi:hypothetical protein